MSDPSLDALARLARDRLDGYAQACGDSDCRSHPCASCCVAADALHSLRIAAPDLARALVAAVAELRSVRSELDVLRANRGTADRLLDAWATIAHAYRVDPSVANAERLAVLATSAAEARDAAIAHATAAEAQRDALAAAVREERDAADAYDAACAALDSDACAVASVRMDAATTATDALLSGCAADVVRAGVVRDHLAALDLLTTTRVDDTTPEMRGNAVATRAALDAALAAAEGRS